MLSSRANHLSLQIVRAKIDRNPEEQTATQAPQSNGHRSKSIADSYEDHEAKGEMGTAKAIESVPTPPLTPQPSEDDPISNRKNESSAHGSSPPPAVVEHEPAPRFIPRPRSPHMIWDQTINQLNSTCEGLALFQQANNAHRSRLFSAESKLTDLLARVKEIEKSRFGLDWDAVVAPGRVETTKAETEEADGVKEEKGLDRVLTRHDVHSAEERIVQILDARAQAIASAKARFDKNSQKYSISFNSKIQKPAKVSKIEVEEHDTILKEIHGTYERVETWEKEISSRVLCHEEEWVTRLANLAIDNGIPPLQSDEAKEMGALPGPGNSVDVAPKLKIRFRTKVSICHALLDLDADFGFQRSETAELNDRDKAQIVVDEAIRRGTRVRKPSARRRESIDEEF